MIDRLKKNQLTPDEHYTRMREQGVAEEVARRIAYPTIVINTASIRFIDTTDRAAARAAGFSGGVCDKCGGMAMVRTGTCETCSDCGTTSGGCS